MIFTAFLLTGVIASQSEYLTGSNLRYNSSCNAIDLGMACALGCREESVECTINCGRNASDPVVQAYVITISLFVFTVS